MVLTSINAAYPSAILYAASKAGLDSVTKSLAVSLGELSFLFLPYPFGQC